MGSVIVSFRCRGELKEWLESYAEARMMTTSLAAQQIISERYQQVQSTGSRNHLHGKPRNSRGTDETDGHGTPRNSSPTDDTNLHGTPRNAHDTEEPKSQETQILDAYTEYWYRPNSETAKFAVRIPDSDKPKYYATVDGAIRRLEQEYGGLGE